MTQYTVVTKKLTGMAPHFYQTEATDSAGRVVYRALCSYRAIGAAQAVMIAEMKQDAVDYLSKNFTAVIIDTSVVSI